MEDKRKQILNQITETVQEEQRALHTMEELFEWLEERKRRLHVSLEKISLNECSPWFYDRQKGCIRNEKGSFFQITDKL